MTPHSVVDGTRVVERRWCFSHHLEGEWRLGCPVKHQAQGVHSNINDMIREGVDCKREWVNHLGPDPQIIFIAVERAY